MAPSADSSFDLCIRDFKPGDYQALMALWAQAGLPFRPRGRDRLEKIEAALQRGLGHLLVATISGELVGSVLATHDGRKGWINRLAVSAPWQHRGIARKLVEEAEQRLGREGIEIVACLIEVPNDPSVQTFEHLGYKRYEGIVYYTKRAHADV